jgi:hypothetical protein
MTQTVQSSNLTGLAFAEEATLKTLPGSPTWFAMEPNSYTGMGAKYTLVSRNTINPSRQTYKGVITDLSSSVGFAADFTQNNLQRLLQGFFFADAHEKPDTQKFNAAAVPITSVTASTHTYAAASGLGSFVANSLVKATNFTTATNNGLKLVTSSSGTTVVLSAGLADETPTSAARLETVGYQFSADDAAIVYSGGTLTLTTTTADLTTLSLNPGEWVWLGGDTSTVRFVNNQYYARIKSIAAHAMVLDRCTSTPVSETTSGSKTVQIFFGRYIRNELTPSLIKRRTYQFERQLGNDSDGMMSEYVTGAVADQFTVNVKEAAKIETDLAYIGCGYETHTGLVGIKSGTRVAALGESAMDSSSDVYAINMSIISSSNPFTSQLFGYVSDAKLVIKNSVKEVKAVSVLGAWDTTSGNFEVSGTITAFFTTVAATAAISANSDVDLQIIVAKANAGWVFDNPLLALDNGQLNVTKDAPITLPLNTTAAQNSTGYTGAMTFFSYLPNLAMPVAQ